MARRTCKLFFLGLTLLALVLSGCGGNGNGGGMTDTGDGDDMMTMEPCPSGQARGTDGQCAPTGPTAEEIAAMEAEVKGLTVAIADPDGDGQPTDGLHVGGDKRPGGRNADGNLFTFDAAQGGVLKFDSSVSATDNNLDELGKPDEAITDNMEFGKSTQAAASLTGFEARVYERTMTATNDDKTTDVLRVYVDSKDAGDVNYFTYFADANNDPTAPRPTIVSGLMDGSADGKYTPTLTGTALRDEGALTFSSGTTITEKDAALFDAAPFSFTKGDSGETKTYASQPTERTFAGSFAGVDGMFVCAGGADCTTVGNKDGQLTTLTGTWSFRPTKAGAEGKVEGVKLDNDYLAYGYWLQTVEKADGSMTYGVNPFATGSMPFGGTDGEESAAVAALRGTAKYTGQATGMYAVKSFESGAGVPEAAGQFTADASLTANFGGNDVAVNDQYSISGTVNNFRDSAGEYISGGGWSVDLLKTDLGERDSSTRVVGTHTNDFGGMTTGGGSWNGMFYGPAADSGADAKVKGETHPTGVAGEFNAHLGNGHVIGAFGATKK